jgi:cytochrome c peroxidase
VVPLLVLSGCKPDSELQVPNQTPYTVELPAHAPALPVPSDNKLTVQRVALGQKLFFDPALSRDSTVSCGSCHLPNKGFTDGLAVSVGIRNQLSVRNAPSLTNVAYSPTLFWDGGVPTLELQALAPIQAHNEMDMDFPTLVQRLKGNATYRELFQKAYNTEPTNLSIVQAIASFERSLVSFRSPYDSYLEGNLTALTPSQIRGKDLFFGEKAECFHCHGGPNLSDGSFQNNGLYKTYADQGRERITSKPEDNGKFKVPTLRNIALTAPYMHDGSLATLSDVVDHYKSGGKGNLNQASFVRPFPLNAQEKADLIAFMEALTDTSFANNARYGQP